MRASKLLVHEWVFGAYMLIMTVVLIATAGISSPPTQIFGGFFLASVVLLRWAVKHEENYAWRIRLFFYPVAMNVLFKTMGSAVPMIRTWSADALLQTCDHALIGRNLSLRCEAITTPVTTEVLSICYFVLVPYLTFTFLHYLCGSLSQLRPFFAGLFTLYGVGFLGYLAFPAGGLIAAMSQQFTVPLEGLWFTNWIAQFIDTVSNHVDAFPSLHCAGSLYILLSDFRYKPWRFRIYLIPAIGLWFSTIYLRYHYFTDVIAGFTLATICYAIARWQERREQPASFATQQTAREKFQSLETSLPEFSKDWNSSP